MIEHFSSEYDDLFPEFCIWRGADQTTGGTEQGFNRTMYIVHILWICYTVNTGMYGIRILNRYTGISGRFSGKPVFRVVFE